MPSKAFCPNFGTTACSHDRMRQVPLSPPLTLTSLPLSSTKDVATQTPEWPPPTPSIWTQIFHEEMVDQVLIEQERALCIADAKVWVDTGRFSQRIARDVGVTTAMHIQWCESGSAHRCMYEEMCANADIWHPDYRCLETPTPAVRITPNNRHKTYVIGVVKHLSHE